MTITAEQLQGAIDRACFLKNVRDAQILEDMQKNMKKMGFSHRSSRELCQFTYGKE